MRNFKKILIVICILSLLAVGCTVWALADEEVVYGSVEELSALITTAEKASDDNKYDAVKAIREYLDTCQMDPEEEGYDEAILRVNAVAVEAADIYLSMIPATWDDNVDIDELVDVFMFADEILTMFDIPDGAAGFNAVKGMYDTALLNLSKVLIQSVGDDIITDPNPNTAKNKIRLNKANGIIMFCSPYTENEEFTAIKDQFTACLEAHEAAVAKKLQALDDMNDVSSYDLPVYYMEDWQNKPVGYGVGNLGAGWSFTSNGAAANRVGVRQEKDGNRYYVHEYRETKNPAGSFAQRSLTSYKTENGLVFEFSIATFGEIPSQGILVETGSIDGKFPNPYLYINGKGDICSNNKSTVLLEGALTKGGWLDIILALDPITFNYSLYVEGQYIASYSATLPDGGTFDHSRVALRLSGGPSTQGEIAYDNFKIYAGSNYRNQDRLTNMSQDEKFVYFVNYFQKDTNPVLDRKESYDRAAELVRNYCDVDPTTGAYTMKAEYQDNAEIVAAVDGYFGFDIETLVSEAKRNNLVSYADLVSKLQKVERSFDTISERNNIVLEIINFNKINLNLVDLECDILTPGTDGTYTNEPNGVADYEELLVIYNRVVKQIDYDKNSDIFVGYMQRFQQATSLAATQRYFNYAKTYVDDDLIDLNLILVETTPYRENFSDLIEAYEIYLNSQVKVDSVNRLNNSKRIVQCVNAINQFRTEEQWEANKDFITEYINIVKDAILTTDENGNHVYDTTYEGIDEAVRFFNRVYSYFYAQMQDEHDEYIGYLLDLIAATDDYVEKIGLVALVDRYVGENDVDVTDPRIALHLTNLETCRSELVLRGEDYSLILQQNSVYFVNFVEKMRTATTYREQVEFYEKAAVLYFSLDTTVEGTAEAVEVFDEYKVKLKRIDESSVKFLEAMAIYRACETVDEQYAALVDCYYNAQFAEVSYDGVAEALAEYQAIYDAYMGYATAANNDITASGHAVGSFRVNGGMTTIVAIIIKKIFGA
jgi:hypothetical protein